MIRKFSVKSLWQRKNKNTQITNNLSLLKNFVQIKSDPVTAHRSDFFAAEQPGAIQISNQVHETSASSNFPDFTISSHVTDLVDHYSMSLNAISNHLKVLEKSVIVTRGTIGRPHWIEANLKQVGLTEDWFKEHKSIWELRLDKLNDIMI